MTTIQSERILRLCDLSVSYDPKKAEGVQRTQIQTIESVFQRGVCVQVLEGEEGIGKSTLLHQFVERNCESCISLFFEAYGASYIEIDTVVNDLYCQVLYAVDSAEPASGEMSSAGRLRTKFIELAQRARRKAHCIFIVVDGLEEIAKRNPEMFSEIISLFPISNPVFRYLFSGKIDESLRPIVKDFRPVDAIPFSNDEARQLFSEMRLELTDIESLNREWGGNPGSLAIVKEILAEGTPLAEISAKKNQKIQRLFEIRWDTNTKSIPVMLDILSLIAFAPHPVTLSQIADLMQSTELEVITVLAKTKFVAVEKPTGLVLFKSESAKFFAQQKLASYQLPANDKFLKRWSLVESSPENLIGIPKIYAESGDDKSLLASLSPAHFRLLIQQRLDNSHFLRQTDAGVRSAIACHSSDDVWRLVTIEAVYRELSKVACSELEIDAQLSLGRRDIALDLANGARLVEDRLQLLAVILHHDVRHGLQFDSLRKSIDELGANLNVDALEEGRCIDLGIKLFSVRPILAISVIEQKFAKHHDANALDWALLKLTTFAAEDSQVESYRTAVSQVRDRMKDATVRTALSLVTLSEESSNATSILAEIKMLEKTEEQVLIMRGWCVANSKRKDAIDVTSHAINLLVTSNDYVPSVTALRDILSPLPHCEDSNAVADIVRIVDSIAPLLWKRGPALEMIRLQLMFCDIEARGGDLKIVDRIMKVYADDIPAIKDLPTRAAALAWLFAGVVKADPDRKFDPTYDFQPAIEKDLGSSITALLRHSADHFEAVSPLLEPISIAKPSMLVSLVESLNNLDRRQLATSQCVEFLSAYQSDLYQVQSLEFLGRLEGTSHYDEACISLLSGVCKSASTTALKGRFELLVKSIEKCYSPSARIKCLLKMHSAFSGSNEAWAMSMSEIICRHVEDNISATSAPYARVSATLYTIKQVGNTDSNFTQKLHTRLQSEKANCSIQAPREAQVLFSLGVLVAKAFSNLIVSKRTHENDWTNFADHMDAIDDPIQRVILWANVACACYEANDISTCKKIVDSRINAEIGRIPKSNVVTNNHAKVDSIVATWLASQQSAMNVLDELPDEDRDRAIVDVIRYVLSGTLPIEPINKAVGVVMERATAQDAENCMDLVSKLSRDAQFLEQLETVTDVLIALKRKSAITPEKAKLLCDRMSLIVTQRKFGVDFTAHDGYEILALAQLVRLGLEGLSWETLLKRARDLPSEVDQPYVLAKLAVGMSAVNRLREKSKETFKLAFDATANIESVGDRIERYQSLASNAAPIEKELAQKSIQAALSCRAPNGSLSKTEAYAGLVDVAHRIDPNYASSMLSLLDKDESRRTRDKIVESRLQFQKFAGQVAAGKGIIDSKNSADRLRLLPDVCWHQLGLLKANMTPTLVPDRLTELAAVASRLPISNSFPIFYFALENLIRQSIKGDQLEMQTRAAQKGLSAAFVFAVDSLSFSFKARDLATTAVAARAVNDMVIMPGERVHVWAKLRAWLQTGELLNLKISDPYFGKEDLAILKLVIEINPKCDVAVLTSERAMKGVDQPWADSFQSYWRHSCSSTDAPLTRIVVANVGNSGTSPIHERWIISGDRGLRIGTSLNSIGFSKISEFVELPPTSIPEREREIDLCLSGKTRAIANQRVNYQSFTL